MGNKGHTELYNLLGIASTASQEDIKKAFRRKAVELHPDKHDGSKEKEEEFKKVNEAYMVLSDPDKRKKYDQFGVMDDAGGGMPPDINDILKGMFGGGMGGGPGFSFVFMNGDEGPSMGPPDDIFASMFGGMGMGMGGGRSQQRLVDVIEIPVEIADIYYGKTRKVEFEMLDQCGKCNGIGAADPSAVIKCLNCDGKGSITQQIGPFFAQTIKCNSCGGNGTTIKNNKICQGCKGQKTVYTKKAFELKIPKGIPNNHEIHMPEKGAFDERTKKNKDILFRFRYDIKAPYTIDNDGNVTYTLNIPFEDILTGFDRKITLYNDEYVLKSDKYFNPNNSHRIPGLGIPNIKRGNKHGDMIIKFVVEYSDSERLRKYNDVLRKILKKGKSEESKDGTNVNIINI
jgi:molecular chaperone DnaJ